jgi:hypothetical protein
MRFVGAFTSRFLALAGVLALSSVTLAEGGYLARVGPKPLRFSEPAQRRDPEKVLPALIMNDEASTNAVVFTEEFGPQPPAQTAAGGIDEELIGEPTEAAGQQQEQVEPPPPRSVTPDALLQFFTPVKRKDSTVGMPIDFTPPSQGGTRSSTATFSSQ